MKITQPALCASLVKDQKIHSGVVGASAEPNTPVETTIGGYLCPQSDTGLATAANSFSDCAGIQSIESGSLDAHSKKEQSVIDSSDSIPNTEEFERLHEPEGEEMVSSVGGEELQINKQNVAIEEPCALSNEGLFPPQMHIYRRRKTKKGTTSTEIVIPALQCVVKKSKQESSIGKEQPATVSESDRKLSSTKVLSHYVRKRSRDVEHDVLKAGNSVISSQELAEGSEYGAVSAGLQAHNATNRKKPTLKGVLHRDGDSQVYSECRPSDALGMWSDATTEDIAAITKPCEKSKNSEKFEIMKKMENREVSAFSCKLGASSRKDFPITVSGGDDLQSKKLKVLEKTETTEATNFSYNTAPSLRDARHDKLDRQKQSSGCSNAEALKKERIPEPESSKQAMELSTPLTVKSAVGATSKLVDAHAKAQQSVEAANCKQPELPKIMSFQKFAKRENMTGDVIKRRPLKRETLALYGKGLATSGVDARHSKVRDWSIDFSDSYNLLGSASLLALYDNIGNSRDGFSSAAPNVTGLSGTEIAGDRHESGVTCNQDEVMPSSKEVTDDASAGSSIRGSHQKPSGVCLASPNSDNMPFTGTVVIENENHARSHYQLSDMEKLGDSTTANPDRGEMRGPPAEKGPDSGERCSLNNTGADEASAEFSRRLPDEQQVVTQKTGESFSNHLDAEKCSDDSLAVAQALNVKHQDTSEEVKKAVTDFIAQLLTPLYKTRTINKDTFKSMMKKATSKVMERRTEQEAIMEATEFLDTKRKLKIRSLIDKLVEQYLESVHRK